MALEKAKDYYLGKNGCKKMNCAQSVAYAFKDKFSVPEKIIAEMGACGGGRAPEGVCGALYAAKKVLGDHRQQRIRECEEALAAKAGSIKCHEIRPLGRLPCLGCVETIAGCVDKD